MVSSSRWKIIKKERRYLPSSLLILICLIIQNFMQFNPTNYYNNPSSLFHDYNVSTMNTTFINTTTTTTNVLTFNINSITTPNTTTIVSKNENENENEDNNDDVNATALSTTNNVNSNYAATTTATASTRILNISTYDDLLKVLDFDRPHYCGYYKCYYSTTTQNSNNNIGLILSQEDWITQQQFNNIISNDNNMLVVVNNQKSLLSSSTNNLNKIQSYYDVLYQSYVFSQQVTSEFPGIRSLLAGPPIQLANGEKPTVDQLYTLNHFNDTTKTTNIQKGDFNKRRLYTNATSSQLSIQEVYEISKIERIQIKLNGQRTLRDFLNKHIIPNFMLNYPLIEIPIHIQQFINTFTRDILEIKLMLLKYPIMGEDFQLFIHMTGHIYQTDWDRIYFIYKWCSISYDSITKTNNHTKMIEYVLPYLDELIDICYGVLNEYNNKTIKEQNAMLQIAQKKAKYK